MDVPEWRAYLDDEALIEAAGRAVFERGVSIARGQAVEVVQCNIRDSVPNIEARVQGTQRYTAQLMLKGGVLASYCTCPHAADGWFCKHQVAVALTWRSMIDGQPLSADPVAIRKQAALAKRARTQAENATALHAFVRAQPAEQLAERLLRWADTMPELRRDLKAWMRTDQAQADPTRARKAVTEILARRGGLDWRGSVAYAVQARQVLPLLDEVLRRDPASALKLVEQTYQRLHTVMAEADDSGGDIGNVCQEVGERWLRAAIATGPHPAALGDRYLALREGEIFDGIGHVAAVQAMGPVASARYGQRCREAWEAALAAPGGRDAKDSLFRSQLRYEEHLRATGDGTELLRVLRSDRTQPYAVLKVVEELERQGRQRESLDEVLAGLVRFPDDDRLQSAALAAYDRDGWDEQALALRRRRFEQHPSVKRFQAVLINAPRAGVDADALRAQMWANLVTREQARLAEMRKTPWGRQATNGPDVSLRLDILLSEQRLDEALLLVQAPHRADVTLLERLALALPAAQAEQATVLLQRSFVGKMAHAQSPYTEALRLVNLIAMRLTPAECAHWLAQLRVDYRTKRNFLQGLPTS
jgi:hypothetical protein